MVLTLLNQNGYPSLKSIAKIIFPLEMSLDYFHDNYSNISPESVFVQDNHVHLLKYFL